MAYLEATLNWASYANSEDKLGFLKSLLQTFGHEELNCAKGLLKRRREKVIKGPNKTPRQWKGPRPLTGLLAPVGHPTQVVVTPGDIYPVIVKETKDTNVLGNWHDEFKPEDFIAFDVEGVHRFKQFLGPHDMMHSPEDKAIPPGAEIKEKEPTIVKAAYLGVVNYAGKVLQEETIKHCPGTFKIDYWSKMKSGVTSPLQFAYGRNFAEIQQEFVKRFSSKYHITCGGENDYKFLELAVGDFPNRFDLQSFYQRPDPENPEHMIPMSLRDIYWYHFKVDFQRGVHNATKDAKATIKIFMDGYRKLGSKDEYDFSAVPNLNSKERKGIYWCNSNKDFGRRCDCDACKNIDIKIDSV